jgi:hypothetical protein
MYVYLRLSLMLILRHCRLYFNVLLTLYEKHILQSPVDATVLRVSTFVGNVWTFIHFTACLMCYVGRLELEGDVNDSWVHLNGFATMSSFDIYIRGEHTLDVTPGSLLLPFVPLIFYTDELR